jgi:purine-nucleoside phosphorylase
MHSDSTIPFGSPPLSLDGAAPQPVLTPIGADEPPRGSGRTRQYQVIEALQAVRKHCTQRPRAGIILGSGLGELARHIDQEAVIPYAAIPHWPRSHAEGHEGKLVCGTLAGVPVVAMSGRSHYYEGYGMDELTLPVRVMRAMGAELLIVSNAAGGVNPRYRVGDIMIIEDHINLMWRNPQPGSPREALGRYCAGVTSPYCPVLIEQAAAVARQHGLVHHLGVYIAVTGPNYETRAEYRAFRRLGGDVVGMSTAPEAIAAAQQGMRVLGFSIVCNVARPDAPTVNSHEEVLAAAKDTADDLEKIVIGVLATEHDPRRSKAAVHSRA